MRSISRPCRNRVFSTCPGFEICIPREGDVTCLPALLTALAVIAASLLGGCSDNAIGTWRGGACAAGCGAEFGAATDGAAAGDSPAAGRTAGQRRARRSAPQPNSRRIRGQLRRGAELRVPAGDLCQPQPRAERRGADPDDFAGGAPAGARRLVARRARAGDVVDYRSEFGATSPRPRSSPTARCRPRSAPRPRWSRRWSTAA